jgi:hypothetical protein
MRIHDGPCLAGWIDASCDTEAEAYDEATREAKATMRCRLCRGSFRAVARERPTFSWREALARLSGPARLILACFTHLLLRFSEVFYWSVLSIASKAPAPASDWFARPDAFWDAFSTDLIGLLGGMCLSAALYVLVEHVCETGHTADELMDASYRGTPFYLTVVATELAARFLMLHNGTASAPVSWRLTWQRCALFWTCCMLRQLCASQKCWWPPLRRRLNAPHFALVYAEPSAAPTPAPAPPPPPPAEEARPRIERAASVAEPLLRLREAAVPRSATVVG